MRFLVDENLSPRIVSLLTNQGHDALFVPTSPFRGRPDRVLHDLAADEGRVVITRDLKFPVSPRLPGIVLFRGGNQTPTQLVDLMQEFMDTPEFLGVVGRITVVVPGRRPRSRRIPDS